MSLVGPPHYKCGKHFSQSHAARLTGLWSAPGPWGALSCGTQVSWWWAVRTPARVRWGRRRCRPLGPAITPPAASHWGPGRVMRPEHVRSILISVINPQPGNSQFLLPEKVGPPLPVPKPALLGAPGSRSQWASACMLSREGRRLRPRPLPPVVGGQEGPGCQSSAARECVPL